MRVFIDTNILICNAATREIIPQTNEKYTKFLLFVFKY